MLHLLDESLESFVRATVPVRGGDIDVSFDAPDRDWGSRVSGPTINLFLWDIRRATHLTRSGMEEVERNGKVHRRRPPPMIEFSYLVTAWASQHSDEHRLLGMVLRAIVANRELPADHLAGALTELRPPPTITLGEAGGRSSAEFWSALNGQVRAGLDLTVTAAVDPDVLIEAGPPTDRFQIKVGDRHGGERRTAAASVTGSAPTAAGGTVYGPRGAARVDPDGQFVISAAAGDTLVTDTDPPLRGIVPDNGSIVLE